MAWHEFEKILNGSDTIYAILICMPDETWVINFIPVPLEVNENCIKSEFDKGKP